MTNNKRAFTLAELIMTMVLTGILLLGVSQLIISHARFSTDLQAKNALSQEAAAIIEDISAKVRNSKYVGIGTPVSPKLSLYGINNQPLGAYEKVANDLKYTDPVGVDHVVSDKLDALTLSDASGANSALTKLVKIEVRVKDPRFPSAGSKTITTTVCCYIAGLPPDNLVRLVDSSYNEKGLFGSIQAAINAPDCIDGDIVQVSFNNNIPYAENITNKVGLVYKAITVKGRYDSSTSPWTQRPLGYTGNAYETIIDGRGAGPVISATLGSSTLKRFTVEGFTVTNGTCGIMIRNLGSSVNDRGRFDIFNNKIIGNTSTSNLVASGIDARDYYRVSIIDNEITQNPSPCAQVNLDPGLLPGSKAYIRNSRITSNDIGSGVFLSYVYDPDPDNWNGGDFNITNCEISNNKRTAIGEGGKLYGGGIDAKVNSRAEVQILNNIISNNTGDEGGGIRLDVSKENYNTGIEPWPWANVCIENNLIEGNSIGNYSTSTLGGALYARASIIASNTSLSCSWTRIANNTIRGHTSGQSTVYIESINPDIAPPTDRYIYFTNNSLTGNNNGPCPLYAIASTLPVIINNNMVRENIGGRSCAGIHIETTSGIQFCKATVKNNLVVGNTTTGNCSGIDIYYPASTTKNLIAIDHNTIAGNTGGGGMYFKSADNTALNSTIYSNISYSTAATGIIVSSGSTNFSIKYSDIRDWTSGASNINVDPQFTGGDYHLQPTSPCIDSGQSSTEMGAYGGSPPPTTIGAVNLSDNSTTVIRENIIGTY